jgi:hypothetical protein
MTEPLRIAMWSGPRNISTAMMRAWENRGDCAVSDEPLYAHYLAHTGLDHPGREKVIAAGDADWRSVTNAMVGPVPGGKTIWYQKQMSHHLLPHIDHGWIHKVTNVFLIRDPAAVVASYVKTRASVTPEDIGVTQQLQLFDELADRAGVAPTVIDADDFLASPEAHLRALCDDLDIRFTPRMLTWPPGPRESDGIWAPHWYAAVLKSTGFEALSPPAAELNAECARVANLCRPAYESMRRHRLQLVGRPADGGRKD